MTRVTEPLNFFSEPWKLDWYARVGKKEANLISRRAMKIGTRVDELIKLSLNPKSSGLPRKTKAKPEPSEVQACLEAWAKWRRVYNPASVTPCVRWNATIEGQDVSGEPDILVDGVLVDIKCARKISPGYWIQVNMYQYLRKSQEKVGILRLDKETASYEYVVREYEPSLVSVWIGLMRAYLYYKGASDDGDEL